MSFREKALEHFNKKEAM